MTDLPARIDQLEERFRAREGEVLAYLPEESRFDRLRAEAQALLERFPDPDQKPQLLGCWSA